MPNTTFIGDGDVSPNQPTNLELIAAATAITSPKPPVVGEQVVTPPAQSAQCTPDTNLLQWINYTTLTGAGQAEVNLLFKNLAPFTDLYFMRLGTGSGNVFIHLEQMTDGIVAAGVLTPSGREHWFQVTPQLSGSIQLYHLRFNKPITFFYMTHADLGVQSDFVFLATSDVQEYGAF